MRKQHKIQCIYRGEGMMSDKDDILNYLEWMDDLPMYVYEGLSVSEQDDILNIIAKEEEEEED